jgi:hypothetical protein
MDKFYWEPNLEDRIGIISGIFEPDGHFNAIILVNALKGAVAQCQSFENT